MIGTVLNERYRLDAELGRGGMAIVYRARDTLLERDVAAVEISESTPSCRLSLVPGLVFQPELPDPPASKAKLIDCMDRAWYNLCTRHQSRSVNSSPAGV